MALSAPHKVQWTREMDEAFRNLRESLCSRVVLFVPVVSDSFVMRRVEELVRGYM